MHGPAPHFPDAGVGLAPDAANEVGYLCESLRCVAIQSPTGLRVDERGLEQVAVYVQLGLRGGSVADANRPRAAVAVELEHAFGRTFAAVEAVENLEARVGELGCVEHPPEERFR